MQTLARNKPLTLKKKIGGTPADKFEKSCYIPTGPYKKIIKSRKIAMSSLANPVQKPAPISDSQFIQNVIFVRAGRMDILIYLPLLLPKIVWVSKPNCYQWMQVQNIHQSPRPFV